jgi:hypothetical protein
MRLVAVAFECAVGTWRGSHHFSAACGMRGVSGGEEFIETCKPPFIDPKTSGVG